MQIFKNPTLEEWNKLVARPVFDKAEVEKIVDPILQKVKRNGDKALKKFALEFDHVKINDLNVSSTEIEKAYLQVPDSLKSAISVAAKNIKMFHELQKSELLKVETMPGVTCYRKSIPLDSVGLYIPGGTAPLFSTILMLGIPAILAGCKNVIICTPTDTKGDVNPIMLYTADILGIKKIIKSGGAQAIAAMAYGTESVMKVDKIFGPGNQYVTSAKQKVFQEGVAIDMPAGPSEVLIFADKYSNPSFIAADLLSQAEHGVDSQVVLVSLDEGLIGKVMNEIEIQLYQLPRKNIAEIALKNSLAIFINDAEQAMNFINYYAPEHLILATKDAEWQAEAVTNAGSVFIGEYTPESAGDYASGTNHTLPTNGWAKSMAGVSLDSFVKKITFQKISPEGLKHIGPIVETMAQYEQLLAHKNAVSIRLKQIQNHNNDRILDQTPFLGFKSVFFGS